MSEDRRVLAGRLRQQGEACGALGSELYAHLLERAAGDVEEAGPTFELLGPFGDFPSSAGSGWSRR